MLLISAFVMGVMAVSSSAATIIGDFEIDGDLVDSAAGAPYDWDSLPGAVVFNDPDTNSGCPAGEDDIFGGSSNEEVPGEWIFDCGSVPQKDDFLEAGIGTREIAGDDWLYLYFIRKFDGGSAVLNYEFNQSESTFDNDGNAATPEVPVRMPGDLLFNLEVANGGAQTTIQVFEWDGNQEIGNWVQIVNGTPVQGTDWDVATNADPNDNKARFTFAELALRLEAFGVTPSCPGLGKAWIKSNSTFDFENGVLKDRTVRKDVPLSNCGVKDWSFTLSPTGIAGVTVVAVYTVEGGETRTIILTDPEGDGTYTATDNQIPPGTVSFHFEVLNGDALIYQSPEDTESFVEGEHKLNEGALAFQIDLSPGAENFVGLSHVFTATVTNAATGDPLPNVPVNFALNEGVPVGCGSIDPTTGVTDAAGQASTTVSSPTPCTTDVVAWINGTQPGATASFDSDEAIDVSTKIFVDYQLTVTPEQATNEIGDDHVFTVLLTKDDHGAPAPLDGAEIDLELLPAEGPAHFTEINGDPASGTTATCVTRVDDPATTEVDETGTCSVTIDSDSPGAFTLHASYEATDDSGTIRIFEDSGNKQFINVTLDVTPDTAENDVDTDLTHEFTVTLERDEGSGLVAYPGQLVSLSLDPGTTGATITSIVTGTIGDPPVTGTCTTDANGQCSVTITATSPGTASLSATWSQELTGGGTITRTDTATKLFSDFALDVTPDIVENDVDTDLTHEFTVTLTRNDGTGFVAYPGQSVSLTLVPGTTGATITSIPNGTIGDPPVTGTCTTDANGQCTVTITATSPGTAMLTATFNDELIGGATVTRSDTATKQFIDFALDVTPDTAQNDVDTDLTHEFTVTLTRDDGTGFLPYAGQSVSLSLNPGTTGATITSIVTGTIGDPPVTGTCTTDLNGRCTVTITATSPGTATLTATFTDDLTGGGTVTRSDTATKVFSDFELTVTPPTAHNLVGESHTFAVRLTRNDGEGSFGYGGQTVGLVLDPGPTDGHFTEINGEPADDPLVEECVTSTDVEGTPEDEGGYCFVTLVATTPGLNTLTATWAQQVGNATFTRTAQATKIFRDISVQKNSCPEDMSPRGGVVQYDIAFSVDGAPLTTATLVDTLPSQVEYVSATPIVGATPITSGQTVTWSWETLPEGPYTGSIQVRVKEDVPLGTEVTNIVTLDAEEIAPKSDDDVLTVSDGGRAGGSRAYGISLDLLGSELIGPTPDSDTTNPGEVLSIPDPFGSDTPLLKLLSVGESDDSTADQEAHSATATALDVDLNVPGILHLQADTVVAKTTSQASATTAGSSRGGSLIQGLVINDINYGVVSEPTTVLVRDPLSGEVLAEVHLLETTRSGAAAGEAQPNANTEFASGIAVNGIHVKVHLLELVDLIVSHSESSAEFPSGIGCDGQIPAVSGSAYALGINLKPDSEDGIDLGNVKVAQVNLPITGGEDSATLLDVNVPGVVTAGVGGAGTEGETTDGDDEDTVPIEATSEGHVADLDLLDGTIRAEAVKAVSHSEAGATSEGKTTIAFLEIGGTNVCESLGLTSICTPEPNTELLIPGGPILAVLNEQIPDAGGLTVNAVHIWILGKDNPFGLPVGADIVIANAHSDAHPASSIVIEDAPTTINVRALSAPSAKRLRKIQMPRTFDVPVAVPGLPKLEVPTVSVPEILQDPVSVVEDLTELALPEAVLDDATQLVETLTDPEAILEALADPTTLFEGLADPAAALEALAEATGAVIDEQAAEETELTPEQLTERLLRLVGL